METGLFVSSATATKFVAIPPKLPGNLVLVYKMATNFNQLVPTNSNKQFWRPIDPNGSKKLHLTINAPFQKFFFLN